MRLKILLSAYACEPDKGSEPEVGWQWGLQMARFHDVTILTRENNRANIERGVASLPPGTPCPTFIYHDESAGVMRLKRRLPIGRLYYMLWQRNARAKVAAVHRRSPFDLFHHITFAGYRYQTVIWGHGAPAVWGPVGGMESVPRKLLPWRNLLDLGYELLRNASNVCEPLFSRTLTRRARSASVVLASTRETQEGFRKMGVEAQLFPTIGIDSIHIGDRTLSPPIGPLKLVYVGQLISLKGIELAIEALGRSKGDATLTLIGSGPLRVVAQHLTMKLGLADRVIFAGRKTRNEVLRAYQDFDLFLFPSLHDSGGFAVIEAMAQGLPVICLDCGGPAISVQDNCGIRVPLESREEVIEGLAAAISAYDGDRTLIVEHGRNARERVIGRYEWNRKGDEMNEIYQDAVKKASHV